MFVMLMETWMYFANRAWCQQLRFEYSKQIILNLNFYMSKPSFQYEINGKKHEISSISKNAKRNKMYIQTGFIYCVLILLMLLLI